VLRRRVSIALTVVLMLALAMPALAAKGPAAPALARAKGMPFRDVPGHWAAPHIQRMIDVGLMNGVGADQFDPNGQITRAQIAVLLCRALGIEGQTEGDGPPWQTTFNDEDKLPGWARNHIRVCYNARLMLGEPQGNGKVFNPNKPLTRQEFVVLLARAVDEANGDTAMQELAAELAISDAAALRAQFRDYPAIDRWAVGYVALAVREGWITGYADRTFGPHRPVSRAEACAVFERLEVHLGRFWTVRVDGTITALGDGSITLRPTDADADETYATAATCGYVMCGQSVAYADLKVGMNVKLSITGDRVVHVLVECDDEELEFTGTVTALNGSQVTVDPDDPEEGDPLPEITLTLASTAIVREQGEPIALAEEHVGRQGEFKSCYGVLLRVSLEAVEEDPEDPDNADAVFTGRIIAVDLDNRTITVDPDETGDEDPSNETFVYALADDVEILDGEGEPIELTELAGLELPAAEFTLEDGEIVAIKLE